jgi:hypothetical protein
MLQLLYTVKNFSAIPVPSRGVTYQTLPGREKSSPGEFGQWHHAAGDGNVANPFLQCTFTVFGPLTLAIQQGRSVSIGR